MTPGQRKTPLTPLSRSCYVVPALHFDGATPFPFADEESGSFLMPPGPSVFYGYTTQFNT
jgi:hypothetical protein